MTNSNPAFKAMPLPQRAGVGLKPQHYDDILSSDPDIGWFEVHAENYMGAGGPPHRYLTAIRERYPLSLHGVGLSIGGNRPLEADHLNRLKTLNERYEPASFSEHLAWSTHDNIYLNDLLPVPYNDESLDRVADHIDLVQETLKRTMLLENPSTYVAFTESTMAEIEFLTAIAKRTGCGLLLDVNNVEVSCTNQNWDANTYIDSFPIDLVGEIHMAGYTPTTDDNGNPLYIDTHDRPSTPAVIDLYRRTIARRGPIPTLVEWDDDVPEWSGLLAEAQRVEAAMNSVEHTGGQDLALAS